LEYEITNVISSFKLDREIELARVYEAFRSISVWDESIFRKHVLIMRIPKPKMSLLIYKTGKVICSGAQSPRDAIKAGTLLTNMLREKGIYANVLEFPKVHNIVAVSSYGREIDLDDLALSLKEVEYEPEQFPAAVVRLRQQENQAVASFLVFPTGKVVCLGCRDEGEVRLSLSLLFKDLRRVAHRSKAR